MEITDTVKTTLMKSDGEWREPDATLIALAQSSGAVYNRSTGFFELNGLTDITTEQMEMIMEYGKFDTCARFLSNVNYSASNTSVPQIRTTLPSITSIYGYVEYPALSWTSASLECIHFNLSEAQDYFYFGLSNNLDVMSSHLVAILDRIRPTKPLRIGSQDTSGLRELYIYKLKYDLNLRNLKFISPASLAYLVANAENTGLIYITVHPTVYTKLTDETDTEWHGIMTTASSKNINFITL